MAGNEHHYIQLRKEELKMCKQIQNEHYSEELFVIKHSNMHTCESALFYDADSNIIEDKCDFDFYHNLTIPPSILDGGNEIVLANMFGKKISYARTKSKTYCQKAPMSKPIDHCFVIALLRMVAHIFHLTLVLATNLPKCPLLNIPKT